MIVVDVNTVAYLFLEGEMTAYARIALQKDREWVVPALWRSEFQNILSTYIRRGLVPLSLALEILESAKLLLEHLEQHPDGSDVLRLAAESGCSAYDCEYVAVAESLRVPLVTSDRQLLKAFPRLAVSLLEFAGVV